MEKWFVINKKADFEELGRKFGINPVTARLIRNRDVISEEEFELYCLSPIVQLPETVADKLVLPVFVKGAPSVPNEKVPIRNVYSPAGTELAETVPLFKLRISLLEESYNTMLYKLDAVVGLIRATENS